MPDARGGRVPASGDLTHGKIVAACAGQIFPAQLSEFLFVTIGPSAFLALVRIDFMAFPLFPAGHQASMFATVK